MKTSLPTIYIEASHLSQDVLDVKWSLLAAGYTVRSTWHDMESALSVTTGNHWTPATLEQLQSSKRVVVCAMQDPTVSAVPMMLGFALAWGLDVIWIGPMLAGIEDLVHVQQYATVDEFRQDLQPPDSFSRSEPMRLVA